MNTPPFKNHKRKVFELGAKAASVVYQVGESPILRQPCREIPQSEFGSEHFKDKLAHLKRSFLKYRKLSNGHGRGMAAPQVGIAERFTIVYTKAKMSNWTKPFKSKKKVDLGLEQFMFIVNPKIVKSSKERYKYPEMCMSAYPVIAPVVRPSWIEFEYQDEKGKKKLWNIKDDSIQGAMLNRVFQHEIDHLDGIINIDRVPSKELILESDPKFYDKATFEEV